jgi:alpha-tubulin suppressor-like RCC1 family protein
MDDYGELGPQGRVGDMNATPVHVTGLPAKVAQIAVGYEGTCALTVGGAVYCWGSGTTGALGNGAFQDALVPVEVLGF